MRARGETRVAAALLALALCAPGAAAQQAAPGPEAASETASAEGWLTPARVIRAGERIDAADLARRPGPGLGGIRDAARIAGLEARTTLFPGRPISDGDLSPPAMVERNQIVTIRFRKGGLLIEAEGKALDRGAQGVRVRVMNLVSRASVVGRVTGPELVEVGG